MNSNQIYSNTLVNNLSYQSQLSDSSELVNVLPTSNINSSRVMIQTNNNIDSNDFRDGSLDLSTDYLSNSNSNVHIVHNYLPVALSLPTTSVSSSVSEILHHQQSHQYNIKKTNDAYIQSKDQIMHIYGDPSSNLSSNNIIQGPEASLPVLTPLKYVEYHQNNISNIVSTNSTSNDVQILMTNDDVISEKSDCESELNELNRTPLKNTRRNLPHKKRIAKKLNADFPLIINTDDSNIRSLQSSSNTPQFECTECGFTIIGQLEFYMHLKNHYEGQIMHNAKQKRSIRDITCQNQNETLTLHANQNIVEEEEDDQVDNSVPENLIIESLEDSQDDIKTEEIEADAFEFSDDPEDMEDFRKEVEKVVETIADTDLPDSSWNSYHDMEDDNHTNPVVIEQKLIHASFSNSNANVLGCDSSYACTEDDVKNQIPTEAYDYSEDFVVSKVQEGENCSNNNSNNGYDNNINDIGNNMNDDDDDDDDDDEDDKPLEQVRLLLKKSDKVEKVQKQKAQNDKDEIELNECLKKIHNFKCNIAECNKTFNSRTALGYHIKTHSTERRYVCDQCGKKFLTNGALKVHLRLHSDERPYKCEHAGCGKSFRQWGDLKYHETSLHSNFKSFVCDYCGKSFARKYSLVIHRRIHTGERNYRCNECDKSFRASSYLLNHKRIHTGEKPYTCSVCSKKFRVQGDLKRHLKIHDRVKNVIKIKEEKKDYASGDCVNLSIKEEKDTEKKPPVECTEVNNKEMSKKPKKTLKRKSKAK